jgi:hypothetical protein
MKQFAIALAIAGTALVSGVGVASAQSVEFGVSPGGPYVDVGPRHHRHWRNDYAYAGRRHCRTVVREHSNRFGERVTKRTRVCD